VVARADRINAMTQESVPHAVAFDPQRIGEEILGLFGSEPPVPGMRARGLQVTGRKAADRKTGTGKPGSPGEGQGRPGGASVLCFTEGTLIDTPQGPRLIEDLAPGDLVTTLVNGSQPVRWIGACALGPDDLRDALHLCPIHIEAGALGNLRPLLVSPEHRLLISDWRAQVYFAEDQVLIPAKALENGHSIRQILPEGGVVYCHLLFDRHEVILAEGALSESFHPGEGGLGQLDPGQRDEIEALFPHLPVGRRRAAFPIVEPGEARALRLPG
jgi:hypothetical protein